MLNEQLTTIARESIEQSRAEGLDSALVEFTAIGALFAWCREHDQLGEIVPPEIAAALQALVMQVMKEQEQEPTLRECPYCHQLHQAEYIEQCPLKPKQGNGRIDA
jgi:hypothetical protein